MQVSAFIPIKKYSHSKRRLASILSEQQRSDLSKAMATQTIKALIQSNICDSITLVTNDPHLIIEGASTFFTESSLNQALNEAIACNDSNNPILIMHADLPRINERDLDNSFLLRNTVTQKGVLPAFYQSSKDQIYQRQWQLKLLRL